MKLEPSKLRARVRELARELSFDDCRICAAEPAAHGAEYQRWLADGCHGTMKWMARDPHRRMDPREVLPGGKSIIVLATNYLVEGSVAGRGAIARYAWGRDYHDVVGERLRSFSATLESLGGRQRVYVDTGPVLERDFATESGLGWNGKSTMQIHRRLGTWFFLSEILTTLEIERDQAMGDRCGTCCRCIDACPTQAITGPHRLDARRCLSYLTIEHKGPIPNEFRRAMGGRIYGCDECLEVCPWNRFAQVSREVAFAAREFVAHWDLCDYLALDEEGFRRLFRGSPVKRTKRGRFLRNVCVALGNVGTREDLAALRQAAKDAEPLIAEHARWAIEEILNRFPEAQNGPEQAEVGGPLPG